MAIKYLQEAKIEGEKVLARFDFNVPLKNGKIQDSTRIDLSLETIKYLLNQGASKIILMSHLGRPKGQTKAELSLEPIASYLADKLEEEVTLTESAKDRGIKVLIDQTRAKIILLENLRFHEEEEKNDGEFAKTLASYGTMYVNDAFGTCHRKHASTYGVVKLFPHKSYAGLLLEKEIKSLNKIVNQPERPFVAICGGAKVSDKIKVIESLLPKVDHLIIGGAMAYPFLKAIGAEVGKSLCEPKDISLAKHILASPYDEKLVLPADHVIAHSPSGEPSQTQGQDIPFNMMGLDIGPKSIVKYSEYLKKAKTVFWNGPMGMFENPYFQNGTFEVAKILASLSEAFTLVGGGDSVSAINKSGVMDSIDHISTGGGASLEYIENDGSLPGINALKFGLF